MTNKRKVLIVDDDEVVQKYLVRALSEEPFDCVCAINGVDGLAMAQAEKPDLIILDINMPEMDGRQMMQELKNRKETEKTPVIMLTGNGQVIDKMAGFELGANDYITKPFSIKLLLNRIREFIPKQ